MALLVLLKESGLTPVFGCYLAQVFLQWFTSMLW